MNGQATPNEIVVEIDIEREIALPDTLSRHDGTIITGKKMIVGNGDLIWPILGFNVKNDNKVRSAFVPRRSGKLNSSVAGLDRIPGQRVHLDVEARVARISDPLDYPENKGLWQQIQDVILQLTAEYPTATQLFSMRPIPAFGWQDLTEEDVAVWQFWMIRFLRVENETRMAVPIQNCEWLPKYEDLLASGRVRRQLLDLDKPKRQKNESDEEFHAREFYTKDDIGGTSRAIARTAVPMS